VETYLTHRKHSLYVHPKPCPTLTHGFRFAFAPKSLPCNLLRIPSVWFFPAPLRYFVPMARSSRSLDGTCVAPGPANAQRNAQPSLFNDIAKAGRR
jgi:hypothetical protein